MDWTRAMQASQTLASRLEGLGLSMMVQFAKSSRALCPLVLASSSPPQQGGGSERLSCMGCAWMCHASKVTRYHYTPSHSAIQPHTRPGYVLFCAAKFSTPEPRSYAS
jgi:hypothetical protein